MARYRVTWVIDLEDAYITTPREAAERALEIQCDPDSTALLFEVTPEDEPTVSVDLLHTHNHQGAI